MTETTPAERSAVWRDDNLQPADRLAAIRKRHAVLAARTWETIPHQHGASGCRCLSCYDDPTGWQIDHPSALDCEELVADSLNSFGRKRGACEAGPLLSYDEADALARAADDIGFLLDLAAATAPASALTDRVAELAQHVTRSIFALKTPSPDGSKHYQSGWDDGLEAAMDAARDAVTAVLPTPMCSDPIECSHEAALGEAEAATEAYRLALSQALGLGTGANWEAIRDRGRDLVAEVAELTRAVLRLGGREQAPADRAAVLREAADALPEADLRLVPPMDRKRVANWLCRLADAASGPGGAAGETQQDDAPYPPSVEWRTQTQRRGDHWITWHGVQYELAEARSDFAETVECDGGRHAWRLIRETTTYTVDAEQPAAVAQPGKDETP